MKEADEGLKGSKVKRKKSRKWGGRDEDKEKTG